ncbi:amino acid adenylation domain-containing protein [Streptomyces sp. NPDC093097]|uniref:amino acid adenylation domain-containing protein n=1 Tax=Streptomyces sp. NPDC093097 TaxID=3366027 RepID=UPI00381FB2A8
MERVPVGVRSDAEGVDSAASEPTGACRPQARTLHALIEATAERVPDAAAVSANGVSLTYAQLVTRARRLALELVRAGVEPDDFVGVTVDRSVDAVVALLGPLFAGAAYIPIAADLPKDRIRLIASDAALRIVTGVDAAVANAAGSAFVPVNAPSDAVSAAAETEVLPEIHPDQAAYAIFTSGSTGRPKGVVISHRSAVGSTMARFDVYPEPSVYAVLAPLTIDAAVAGLYFTLAAGGRVVLPDEEEIRDPQLLADCLVTQRVSHLDGLPAQYAALLRFHPEAAAGLRCVIVGGEALPRPLAQQHLAEVPGVELYNEYGPTESTVWATTHRCTDTDPGPHVPIGPAVAGLRTQVLTDELLPAAVGEIGEIWLSGPGLARGYLARAALTAERFTAHPDPRYPGERMYRTGDLGHVDELGELVYHGRSDHLVKVRGFRVELGEIEARLREHPGVLDVVVVPHIGVTGVRLVAVTVLALDAAVGVRELSAFAADRLPAYMLPALWRQADALPVAAGGKVDRPRLQAEATTVGNALPVQYTDQAPMDPSGSLCHPSGWKKTEAEV